MPNFKLGETYHRTIKAGVNNTLQNYIQGFMNGFPLTHDEVQSRIMSRELLTQFEMLWAAGARTIQRSTRVTCLLDRDATAGLRRSCVIIMCTTREDGFFTQGEAQPYLRDIAEELRGTRVTRLDLRYLPHERVQAVVEWCHLLIRAHRLRDMVNITVEGALRHCTSTAHLMANWPELATFAKEDVTLRKRLVAAPAKLDRYKVSEFHLPPKKQRDAANVVLTMGAMALEASKNADEAEVRGNVPTFESLPTDPIF